MIQLFYDNKKKKGDVMDRIENKNKIKPLLNPDSKKGFIQKENQFIDNLTGEITANSRVIVKEFKHTDEFIKFFSENLEFVITELTSIEKNVFFSILMYVNYSNIYIDNSDFRRYISKLNNISPSSVSRALTSLEEKEVILLLDTDVLTDEELVFYKLVRGMKKAFLINPNLVGKGSFRDLMKMRQVVIRDFDRKGMRYRKEIRNDFVYEGMEEVQSNIDNYDIKIEEKAETYSKHLEVGLIEKEQPEIINVEPVASLEYKQNQLPKKNIQPSLIQESESNDDVEVKKEDENLELLREQGRVKALELEIKNKEIELIRLKLKERLIMEGKIEEALKI